MMASMPPIGSAEFSRDQTFGKPISQWNSPWRAASARASSTNASAATRRRSSTLLAGNMPIHPHSGVAAVTVLTEGRFRYDDPTVGSGTIGYGGVEWMRAGGGVWHGKEMAVEVVPRLQGFQLWLSLPAGVENGEPASCHVEAEDMVRPGPAHLILGEYETAM